MLSSQQRALVRIAKRRVSGQDVLGRLVVRKPHHKGSLAGFSTHPSFPSSSSNQSKDDRTRKQLSALPSVNLTKNALLRSTLLERAYPLGVGQSPMFWFSTTNTTKEEEAGKAEYGYRERARSGAKSFGGMMKKYGPTFVATYLSVYVGNLSLFYLGIASGMLDPVMMIGYVTGNHEEVRSTAIVVSELLEKYTITAPFAETVKEKPNLANFAVAWISTKFTEPIRMGVSVAIVPSVARYFGTIPKTEEEIEKEESEGVDAAFYAEQRESENKSAEKKH